MTSLSDLLFWLDASPARYWVTAWGCFILALLLIFIVRRDKPGWMGHPGWYAFILILTLFAFRWPALFYRSDLNPDEAQIVAGAITLNTDPAVWRSLDTTTHGPLLEYPLVIAHLLGAPFSYSTARVIGILFQAIALIATWRTLRRFAPEHVARLGVLPGLTFWCLISWEDFLHYSSELPGIALLAVSTWAMALVFTSPAHQKSRWIFALISGFTAGLVPFSKLQSVPHAAGLLLIGAGLIWFMPTLRHRRHLFIALSAGVALVGLIFAIYVQTFSLWREFWFTYVASALAFIGTSSYPFSAMPGRFYTFAATAPVFSMFFWGGLGFAVLYLREIVMKKPLRVVRRIAWVLLALALFTVLRPGRESAHYLQLLITPLCLLTGLTLAGAWSISSKWRVLLAFSALTIFPQVWDRLSTGSRFIGNASNHWHESATPTARYMIEQLQPGDTMALWGWGPHLFVELQLPHATREAQSGNQIMQWPLTSFFVQRYLNDIKRSSPTWFVDVVGPGAFIFDSRATQAHESIPELRKIITRDYLLITEISSTRIYRRKSEM